jgi:hypothetical protein
MTADVLLVAAGEERVQKKEKLIQLLEFRGAIFFCESERVYY